MSSGNFLLSHKTIADLIDSRSGIKEILNFPLTISLEEPEPVRKGHIWIQSDKEINNILIRKYLPLNVELNDICIVCGDISIQYEIEHDKKDESGNYHNTSAILGIEHKENNIINISEINDDLKSIINAPNPKMIYIKTEYSWDLIDAFYYNGDNWIQFGLKERIFALGKSKEIYFFSFNGENLNLLQTLNVAQASGGTQYMIPVLNKEYFAIQDFSTNTNNGNSQYYIKIFKRDGIIFSLYSTISSNCDEIENYISENISYAQNYNYLRNCYGIRSDGSELYIGVLLKRKPISGTTDDRYGYFYVAKFINNGNEFIFEKLISGYFSGTYFADLTYRLTISPDGRFLAIYHSKLPSTYSNPTPSIRISSLENNKSKTFSNIVDDMGKFKNENGFKFSDDGRFFVYCSNNYVPIILEMNEDDVSSSNQINYGASCIAVYYMDFIYYEDKTYYVASTTSSSIGFSYYKNYNRSNRIYLIDLNNKVLIKDIISHDTDTDYTFTQFKFTKDGNYLYTRNSSTIRVYSVEYSDDEINIYKISEFQSNEFSFYDYFPLMTIN